MKVELWGKPFSVPFATLVLITLNLLAWFIVASAYHLSPFAVQNSALLIRAGALNGELLRSGEWWRIITSQFLHVHFPHLAFNMLALLLLGALLEQEIGSWRLLLVYLMSGVIGQIAGVWATPALVSSGASQAVMGLAGGAFIQLLRKPQRKILLMTIALVIVFIQASLDLASSGSIKAGHLAGFCAGAAITYALHRSHDLLTSM